LSSGEVAAIVFCCLAVLVGIMITAIILLTYYGFKLKRKQLQVIQTSNSGHSAIQEESIAMSTANVEQQTQATFHCALNDEVSSAVQCYCAQWIICMMIFTAGLWLHSLYSGL
jgi:hypothetical protein